MTPALSQLTLTLVALSCANHVLGDTLDWVNPAWLLTPAARTDPNMAVARKQVISSAKLKGASPPWSVINTTYLAPSGNPQDYLSWAPYHWPDCNWCSSPSSSREQEVYLQPPVLVSSPSAYEIELVDIPDDFAQAFPSTSTSSSTTSSSSALASPSPSSIPLYIVAKFQDLAAAPVPPAPAPPGGTPAPPSAPAPPTNPPVPPASPPTTDPTAQDPNSIVPGTPVTHSNDGGDGKSGPPPKPSKPSQSAKPTQPAKPNQPTKPTKTNPSGCVPSPTKSAAPSATWKTCPYITRDGDRNPDVDFLPDATSLNDMPLAVLYNALAFGILSGSSSSSTLSDVPASSYASTAASYIDTFFLNPTTAMTPSLAYGQMIRGPGGQGQFMGIVDARGFVSVFNSIGILKALGSSAWNGKREAGMRVWAMQYENWMVSSGLGTKAGQSPNNHGTFWMAQIAAIKYYLGDYDGVRKTINYYITHQFLDQIAASGEQPFEAVRTRPFHYRCFNLEAMIVLAKLGDQVGINMWAAQSRYRATIQDALDYVLSEPPGNESIQSLLPHVASVAVAYGDPKGTYAKFVKRMDDGASHRTWWWHDVPGAFGPKATVSHNRRGGGEREWYSRITGRRSSQDLDARDDDFPWAPANATDVAWAPGEDPIRPDIFGLDGDNEVELDDGVVVSWDDIRPYYAALKPGLPGGSDSNGTDTGAQSPPPQDDGSLLRSKGPARIRSWH